VTYVHQALKEGKLGDQSLSLPSLITTYRRQVLLKGLMAHASPTGNHGTGAINMAALEQLFESKAAQELDAWLDHRV
jgi:hypothetical protein